MFRTWIGPKHVDVINKIDEIYWEYCAPSWFHLQDNLEMHGQQNIKFSKLSSSSEAHHIGSEVL